MDNIVKINSFYLFYIIIGSLTIFFYKADSRSHIERSRNVRPFDYRTFAMQQQHQQHFNYNHPQTAKSLLMYKTKGPIYFGAAAVPMFFYDKLLAMPRLKKYSYGNILLYGEKQRKSINPTRDIVVPYNLVKTFNTNVNHKFIPVKNMGPFFRTKSMYDEMPSPSLRAETSVKMLPQCNQNGLIRSICSTAETLRSTKLYSETPQFKLLPNSRFIEKDMHDVISAESNFKEHPNTSASNQQFSYQLTPPVQSYSGHSFFTLDDVIIPSTYKSYYYNRTQFPEFNNNLYMYNNKMSTSTEAPFTFLDFFSNEDLIRKTATTTTTTTSTSSTTTQSIPIHKYTEYNSFATQATLVDPFEKKQQTTTSFTNLNINDFYEYKDFQSNWIPKTTKDPWIPERITTTVLPTITPVNLFTTNSNTDEVSPFTDLLTTTKGIPVVTTIATIKMKKSIRNREIPEFRQRLRTKFQESYKQKQRLSSIRNNVASSTQTTNNNTMPSAKVTKRKFQRNSKFSRLKFPRKETYTIESPTMGQSKRPKSINNNTIETKYSRIRSIFSPDPKNKTESSEPLNDLRTSHQTKKNDTLASDIPVTAITTTTTTTTTYRPRRKFSKRRQLTTPLPTRDMREILQSRKKTGTTDLPLPILKKPLVKETAATTTEKIIPEVRKSTQTKNKTTRKPIRSESAIMTITSNHDNNSEKSSAAISKKFRKLTNNSIYRNSSSITEVPPLPIEVYFRKTNQAEV